MAPYCSFRKPNPSFMIPSEAEHPYVVEMFGELYFAENHPKPVTMSELFADYPMPQRSPSPDQAMIEEQIANHHQEEDKKNADQKDVPNGALMPAEEQVINKAPRPTRLTRACLYNYPPPKTTERVFPPPLTILIQRYGPNAFPHCRDAANSHEGGSSSGVTKEALGEEKKNLGSG